FDFAYITLHGTPGENGILQGYFDLIGLPYSTSDVLVEALTFNKFALNNFLRAYPDLHISDSVLVRQGEDLPDEDSVIARLGLPCFVKPNAGGSSFGVTKVKEKEALHAAIEKAMMESSEVMIERMMSGTEITCGCYRRPNGDIVTFPITEVVTTQEFFDYDAKYNGKVSEITPARIAPETAERVADTTRSIYRRLGCYGIIRIDYILTGEKGAEQINMLEINTTPGMTATSFIPQQVRAAGLDIKDVLSEIIEGKF
ncbi:MAG: ATP-grasp domain-containing protein, partial [Bacteroidales bacterium]